jgi:putative membrane protein
MARRARLHEVGEDPDYRFTLANERTFLAWVRTALALNAGGLAVIELLPPLAVSWAREVIGIALVAMGSLIAATSYRRWLANERAMRQDEPLPMARTPLLLAGGAALASVTALVLLILSDLP